MQSKLEEIRSQALSELERVGSLKELDAWRVSYLGRKGKLTQILRSLKDLPLEQRREVGSAANELKELLEERLAER